MCKVLNGYAFKSELFNSVGDGLPLIRIRDVNTGFSDTSYSGDYDERYIVENGDILIGMDGDFRATRWKHGRALLNQRVCRLEKFADDMLPDFMYYEVQDELDRIQNGTQRSTVKHLSSRDLERARIPVPPLDVQREVVRVLDLFSGLAADLATQLNAELEARQRQYAYYRDDLFTFRDIEGVKRVPMGDMGKFIRGRRFTKNDVVEEGIPSIHYGEIYTTYGIATSEAASHVREDLAPQLRYAKPGDVVIAAVGETVEDVGKAVAWLGTTDIAIHDDCFLFRSHLLDPKFVSYYLQTEVLNREKAKYVARAKVKRLSGESLAKLMIPVPSLTEQKRIVAILDKFGALVTDLSAALPAELNARRKQYEHYRDRLLTFEELAA